VVVPVRQAASVAVEVPTQQHVSPARRGCHSCHLIPHHSEVFFQLCRALEAILAAVRGEVNSCKEEGSLEAVGTVKTEPKVVRRGSVLAISLPQADSSTKALMHQHSNATGGSKSPAATKLPHTVPRDARHTPITSKMGFHYYDDIGIPT
jgi:hypothetical protein